MSIEIVVDYINLADDLWSNYGLEESVRELLAEESGRWAEDDAEVVTLRSEVADLQAHNSELEIRLAKAQDDIAALREQMSGLASCLASAALMALFDARQPAGE